MFRWGMRILMIGATGSSWLVRGVIDMRPANKPTERTTLRYEELRFDTNLEPAFFSLHPSQRGR